MSMDCARLGWSTSYELDYPLIDGEHRYLFDLVMRVRTAIAQRDSAETISLVGRFVAACQFHFLHEEQIMRDIGFDKIDRHTVYHRKLLNFADDLLDQCETASDIGSIQKHFQALSDCLLDDIIVGDQEFLPHLHGKGMIESPPVAEELVDSVEYPGTRR